MPRYLATAAAMNMVAGNTATLCLLSPFCSKEAIMTRAADPKPIPNSNSGIFFWGNRIVTSCCLVLYHICIAKSSYGWAEFYYSLAMLVAFTKPLVSWTSDTGGRALPPDPSSCSTPPRNKKHRFKATLFICGDERIWTAVRALKAKISTSVSRLEYRI